MALVYAVTFLISFRLLTWNIFLQHQQLGLFSFFYKGTKKSLLNIWILRFKFKNPSITKILIFFEICWLINKQQKYLKQIKINIYIGNTILIQCSVARNGRKPPNWSFLGNFWSAVFPMGRRSFLPKK